MPSFLRDLSIRRRSKLSFRGSEQNTPPSASGSSSNDGDNTLRARNQSSSTLNSYQDNSSSPPTTLSSERSKSNGHLPALNENGARPPPVPTASRPRLPSNQSSRYSIIGMPPQNGDAVRGHRTSNSPFAPRVLSVSDCSWVNQQVLLVFGTCADPEQPLDGTVIINHHLDNFPATQWPACDSHFKALVWLQPGPNRIRLDFVSPKLSAPSGQMHPHSSWMNINYLPLTNSPPIRLCILVAKDSPETYDAVPERIQKEGNGLPTAIKKFKMATYLWQAFTAEQMNRNGFGRRVYRYEEEWQPGSLTWKDGQSGQLRSEPKIHVVRLNKTVQEIQDLDIAQQYGPAKRKGELFDIAKDAIKSYFRVQPGQVQYVSCMFLDSHWDKKIGTIRGHAALGGGDESLKLAIFGSHCLQSYPAHVEEVVPAFSDCTRTDANYVANDCNDSGSNWEAVNIGIGAHLHETGHLLGCPHQESGIMLRDYVRFNRTFTCREPYSTRTKQQGQRLCLPKDECGWHRLDALRFRFHPCFRIPSDLTMTGDPSVQVWSVENGAALITALTGIAWIELFPEGDELCHHWIDYMEQGDSPASCPRQVMLCEAELKERLPEKKRKKNLKLRIFSCGGGEQTVDDFYKLASKDSKIKLPDGRPGFKSSKLGFSQMEGSQPAELILGTDSKRPMSLCMVRIFHGNSIDGLEFFYEGGHSELFGKRGGRRGGTDFPLDIKKAETILGFYVRAGLWIDGVQILTSTGRRSEVFGNATGGSGHTLIPPRGYSIAGIYGSCGSWIDGFGVIITR